MSQRQSYYYALFHKYFTKALKYEPKEIMHGKYMEKAQACFRRAQTAL